MTSLALALSLTLAAASQGGGPASGPLTAACARAVEDLASPGQCIAASSAPLAGTLLPLGPFFFVAPGGEVGIGTTTPEVELDVAGDLRADGRIALGNAARLGPIGAWDWTFDSSQRLTDLSSGQLWAGNYSEISVLPDQDMTGPNEKWIWGHMLGTTLEGGQPYDLFSLQGPNLSAQKYGSGTVTYVVGGGAVAETNEGHTLYQAGFSAISLGDNDGTVDENAALEVVSGHWGAGVLGHVENDYGVYVYTPSHDSPLRNHFGLYLEDQVVAEERNYAIYSAGGASYHAGDLGLGVQTPAAKLDVDGDLVASGTKSFVQPHPEDPTKEIWFVCLEGNEAGTYFRGTARLEGGRAVIPVPADFRAVSEPEGLTVQLTPLGGPASLWVESQDLERIVVRGDRDVELSYLVNGLRQGYAGFETVRERRPEVEPMKPRARRDLRAALERDRRE